MDTDRIPLKCSSCGMPCMEKMEFLSGLTDEARRRLLGKVQRRTYAQGTVIVREAESIREALLIHVGKVKLVCWDGDGREQIVGIFSRGDIICEGLFLEDGRYPYTVICMTDVDICRIQRETVREAVAQPEIAYKVIDLLSQKLRDANERNRFLTVADPESRLAGFLLYRSNHGTSDTVSLKLDEIAASICLRPETVSRKIKTLEQKGLVKRVGQSRIRLLSREQLKEVYLGEYN